MSRNKQLKRLLLLACLVGLLAIGLLATSTLANDDDATSSAAAELEAIEREAAQQKNSAVRANFKLPKMFNFERFKGAFKKHYRSALEEMVRMKVFLARAYHAFITAVKYKYRQTKHYLAVNSRSDWTKQELEATFNKMGAFELPDSANVIELGPETEPNLKQAAAAASANSGVSGGVSAEELADLDEVESELKDIEEHSSETGYAQLASELRKQQQQQQSRRKREIARSLKVRDNFDLKEAFEREAKQEIDYGKRIESNNPNYEPQDIASEMSLDELRELPGFQETYLQQVYRGQIRRDYDQLPVKGNYKTDNFSLRKLTAGFVKGVYNWINGKSALPSDVDERDNLESKSEEPDVVWVDHRQGGCMMPVQEQGQCGSCYAFGVIAFLEWALCMESGERVKLSEQYVVDCGPRVDGNSGCGGGVITKTGVFIQNFGLELARHYPYKARNEQCPYEPNAQIDSMGYLKVDLTITAVPIPRWEAYLDSWPMVINISPEGDFPFYGGGVYDGKQCKDMGTHTVVLIGHGREDGEEYWLIRNSYSEDYGEQGHIKLNKNSDCVHPRSGYIYADVGFGKPYLFTKRNPNVPVPVKKISKQAGKQASEGSLSRHEAELAKIREQKKKNKGRK